MRFLGRQYDPVPSSSPIIVAVIFNTATRLPVYAWVQESQTDVNQIMYDGTLVSCVGLLDDVAIRSSRPQSGGGLRRNATRLSLNVTNEKGYPIIDDPISKKLYYGGSNLDAFYFGIFGIDRAYINQDVKNGASYGFYTVDNEIAWTEKDGVQSISLIDILLLQTDIVGATEEDIDDSFFIYNPWFAGNFFLKAYGQVPRVRVLNAFPSFSVKNFSASIGGQVRSAYTNISTTIVLETGTNESSLLLQAVTIGGTVRIRMLDGEVIAGTLAHDPVLHTITLTITARNTYYNEVTAYNDSLDGRSPDQWGTNPSYSTVRFSPFQTVIPNAKELILDQNGYMQADIDFFDVANIITHTFTVANCVCKIQGLLDQRKDVVIHSFWPDSRFPNYQNQGSISGFYNIVSNAAFSPPGSVILWGIDAFEWLKFKTTLSKIKLYFNNPSVSVPGSGSVGDAWSMVNITPDTVDKSCYIRNGYSRFNVNNVYVEGEGKLIKVPPGNITITQSATFYGLTNLTKFAFTEVPLDMGIGAKSNLVYVDALYRTDDVLDSRAEVILREIIKENDLLTSMVGTTISAPQANNYLPYIGWIIKTETSMTDIIDRICYQCGITLKWRRDKFNIEIAGLNQDASEDYTAPAPVLPTDPPAGDYIVPKILATDVDEMLENTAGMRIGRLRTNLYADEGMQEYIPLYVKFTYGDWEDPFYAIIRSNVNRNIKPYERIVEYHFDLINDPASFVNAVGKSLSIGHASGYTLAQRSLQVDMSLQGCQWEAMCPIVFNNFPLVSTVDETNAYYVNGSIIYPKRVDGKHYLMGAVCVVEDVTYEFNVENPVVRMYARNSQLFVVASGLSIQSPPPPPLEPTIPTDPNVPPNVGRGGSFTVVGNDWLMPHIITPNPPTMPTIVNSNAVETTFDIFVDHGFIFNKGWAFTIYIVLAGDDIHSGSGALLNIDGVQIISGDTGAFPDKVNGGPYPGTPQTVTVRATYLFFANVTRGYYSKDLQLVLHKRWLEGITPCEEFVLMEPIVIRRAPIEGVEGV